MIIFVYGTLKRGYGNHRHYLDGKSTFLGPAHTVEKFLLLNAGFPVMMRDGGVAPVTGEVFDIGENERVLAGLDGLEGEGYMYLREKIQVGINEGFIEVSTYIGNPRYWANSKLPHCPVVNGRFEWSPK